jgi:hypothetical protein
MHPILDFTSIHNTLIQAGALPDGYCELERQLKPNVFTPRERVRFEPTTQRLCMDGISGNESLPIARNVPKK